MVTFKNILVVLAGITAAFAAPLADADAPDFHLGGGDGDNLARRQDYNQHFQTSGYVDFSPWNNGYSTNFYGAGDFVVGKGWSTGSWRTIYYKGSTTRTAGTVLTTIYGWTTNPLVEYYVREYNSDGMGSVLGTWVSSVTCDGAVYDIYTHQQVNKPSIVGTATFNQYISNRREASATSGTVTMSCHFEAWAKLGLNLGTFKYQILATEGWGQASGKAWYNIWSS